jgi:septum site-determining protein MinC
MAVSELVNRTIRHPAFQVTGRGTDVAFVIDSDASFEDVTGDLRAYLVANGGMFSSGNITVDVGSRLLFQEEIAGIRRIIETHSGLTVSRFWCAADALESGPSRREPGPSAVQPSAAQPSAVQPSIVYNAPLAVGENPARAVPSPPPSPVEKPPRANVKGLSRNRSEETLLIKAPFRSGEFVNHPGDVVVLADVNPGAEIRADGDIVVLGTLKGLVHAGASGDARAVVIATELASPRIQIGPHEAVAPPPSKKSPSLPQPAP